MNYRLRCLLSCMLTAVILFTSFDFSAFAAQAEDGFEEEAVVLLDETDEEVVIDDAAESEVIEEEPVITKSQVAKALSAMPDTYSDDTDNWSLRWKEKEDDTWNDHILTLAHSHIYDFKEEYRYYLFSGDHMITQEEFSEWPISIDNNGSYIAQLVGDDSEDPNGGVYMTVDKSNNYEPVLRIKLGFEGSDNTPYVYFVAGLVRYSYTYDFTKTKVVFSEDGNITFPEGQSDSYNMMVSSNPFEIINITHDESDSITVAGDISKYSSSTYFNVKGGGETTFHIIYKLAGCDETLEQDFKVTITPKPVITEEVNDDYTFIFGKSPYRAEEGEENPSDGQMHKHTAGYPILGVIGFENTHHTSVYDIESHIKNVKLYIDGKEYKTYSKNDLFYKVVTGNTSNPRFTFNLGYVPKEDITAGEHNVKVELYIDAKDKSEVYTYIAEGTVDFISTPYSEMKEFYVDYKDGKTYMPEGEEPVWIYSSVNLNGFDKDDIIKTSELVWEEDGEVIAVNEDVYATENTGLDPLLGEPGLYLDFFNTRIRPEYVGNSKAFDSFMDFNVYAKDVTKDGFANAVFTSEKGKKYIVKHVAYFIGSNTKKVLVSEAKFVDGTTARDNNNLEYLMPDICGDYLSIFVYKGRNYSEETIPTFYSSSDCTKAITVYDKEDPGCTVERDPYHPEYIYYTVKKINPTDEYWAKNENVYVVLEGMDKANAIRMYYKPNPVQGAMILGDKVRIYLSPQFVTEGNTYLFQTGSTFQVKQEAVVQKDISGLYAEFTGNFANEFWSYNRIQINTDERFGQYAKYYLPDSMSYDSIGNIKLPYDMETWELHYLTVMGSPIESGTADDKLPQEKVEELALSGDIFRLCYRDSEGAIKHWLFVKFKSSKTQVTFEPNGGYFVSDSGEVLGDTATVDIFAEGDSYSFRRVEMGTGYVLKGWYTKPEGGQKIDEDSVVGSEDITLYAQWEPMKYTIEFDLTDYLNGHEKPAGTVAPITVAYDEEFELPKNITLDGYNLDAWVTLNCDEATLQYTIRDTYKLGKKYVNLWDGDADQTTIVLYPLWTVKKYKVLYAFDSVNNPLGIPQGKSYDYFSAENVLTLPMPKAIEGYEFSWYSNSKCTVPVTSTQDFKLKDTTVYGKWTAIKYSITFDANADSSVLNTATIKSINNIAYNKKVKLPKNTFKRNDGFVFAGWSTSSNSADGVIYKNQQTVSKLSTTNDAIVTLYAVWQPNRYKITYKNHKSVSYFAYVRTEYTVLDNVVYLPYQSQSCEGYSFDGWYTGKKYAENTKIYSFDASIKKNLTVYAKWIPIKYNVVFDKNYETDANIDSMTPMECTYNKAYKLIANSYTRDGYVFVGWNTMPRGDGTTYVDKTSIKNLAGTNDANVILYAQWAKADELEYTIKFDGTYADDGNAQMDAITVKYGQKKNLPANKFKKKYFKFVGWTDEEDIAYSVKNDKSDAKYANTAAIKGIIPQEGKKEVVLYPVFVPIEYTFTRKNVKGMMLGDGTAISATSVKEKCIAPSGLMVIESITTKPGYINKGFYLDSKFKKPIKAVNFNPDDEKQRLELEAKGIDDSECVTPKNVTLYMKWEPIKYNIAFTDNMATSDDDKMSIVTATYNKARKLPANTYKREGMTFVGWRYYDEAKGEYKIIKNKATVKNLTTYSDKTVVLTAVWAPTKYTIQYNDNGADNTEKVTMKNVQAKYGTTVKLATNYYEKEASTFIGWSTDPYWTQDSNYTLYTPGQKVTSFKDIDNVIVHDSERGNAVNLYAIWE